jgi:RimJ/RimL family protein N-acetyltransferase
MAAAENQVDALRHLQAEGWIRLLGRVSEVSDAALAQQVQTLWNQPAQLEKMAAQGAAVVDGLGASRVAAEMLARGSRSAAQPAGPAGDAVLPVVLAPLSETHLERLTSWKNDAALARQIAAHPAQFSDSQVREWMQRQASDPNQVFLGIFAQTDGAVIGVARLMFIDWVSGVAELGIFIGDGIARGRGLGQAAVRLLLQRAFGPLGLHRVFLRVIASNEGAVGCYRACGFTEEGRLREHFLSDGVRHDMLVMGVLRTDTSQPRVRD